MYRLFVLWELHKAHIIKTYTNSNLAMLEKFQLCGVVFGVTFRNSLDSALVLTIHKEALLIFCRVGLK